MTETQAFQWCDKNGINADFLLDPIARAEVLGTGITAEIVDAHLDQFVQAYSGRLGENAMGIGYTRNVDGQGIPDV